MPHQTSAKLELLLEYARRTCPFYAARIPEGGARSAEGTLAALPVLTRSDLQRERARLWSTEGDPSTWRLVRTSGTTGEPLEVVLDEEAREAEAIALAEHVDRCLGDRTWRTRTLFHLALHVGAASGAMPAPWDPAAHVVKWNLIRAWQASDPSFLASLAHLDGHVVTTMPSVAELISSRVLAAGAAGSIVPLLIVLSGETLDDTVREQVHAALGCPVTSLYTLAEVGVVGSECSAGGYHMEDQVAVVEILDEFAHSRPLGAEGDVVITALSNRAMPMIRYCTGDRGHWAERPCGCGRSSDRLVLRGGRRPVALVSADGATVNVIRFAKVIAGLNVDRIALRGTGPGAVRAQYHADRALELSARSLLESTLRSALGPTASIVIERASPEETVAENGHRLHQQARAEPAGPSTPEVAAWLKDAIAEWPGVEAAVITGSYLDPEATTRFSDIDVVILLDEVVYERDRWTFVPLVRELRSRLPSLRVSLDVLRALPDRAPLLACRLLEEQFPVLGTLSTRNLPWPRKETLRLHGRTWAQDTHAALWDRLTDPALDRSDLLRTAWHAAKQSVNALRYVYVVHGEHVTASRAVLSMAVDDHSRDWPWTDVVLEAFDVAREHRPPPDPASAPAERYLAASMSCVESVSRTL
jgi:phenylacetate-coenzyme A ligase PaaK-like adenylate-forming protein